jgi:hypothetical protein
VSLIIQQTITFGICMVVIFVLGWQCKDIWGCWCISSIKERDMLTLKEMVLQDLGCVEEEEFIESVGKACNVLIIKTGGDFTIFQFTEEVLRLIKLRRECIGKGA